MAEERSIILYLSDIAESINQIELYVKNQDAHSFFSNQEKQDAVIRRIEIIGEAAGKILNEIRDKYPKVPWAKIKGMRNIVVHQYFGITPELIWQVATVDVRELKPQIEQIIKDYQ